VTGKRVRVRQAVVAAITVGLIGMGVAVRPDRAIRVGSAVVSQALCSAIFVSGLSPDSVYATTLRPMGHLDLLDLALRYRVDTVAGTVSTSVAGLFRSRALHRPGAGCVLLHGSPPPPVRVQPFPLDSAASAAAVETRNDRIRAVLDRAFSRPDLATTAVVVLHGDSIIAERYAPGYGTVTRLPGWSLTKSVINALVSILVREGRLDVHQPAPVRAWNREGDPRHAITVDHLLRMTSGLALRETNSGFDPVSRMLFLERDMAAFAERALLEAPPGSEWHYSTGNTVILGRVIRDAVGGSADDVARFAREALFAPVGMRTALLEFDATGVPIAMYASARDWARFGRLFATDGVVGAQRILPEGWVTYSTTPTLQSGYGAGWWLAGPLWRPDWQLPSDAFYAAGHLHQKVLVIPSAGIVIARFGTTHAPDDGLGVLAQEVLGALHLHSIAISTPSPIGVPLRWQVALRSPEPRGRVAGCGRVRPN
jgi:CubicO group peptidase (beta-lactamase class C family)